MHELELPAAAERDRHRVEPGPGRDPELGRPRLGLGPELGVERRAEVGQALGRARSAHCTAASRWLGRSRAATLRAITGR